LKIEELINYGIPLEIINKLINKGYSKLFPPQIFAIEKGVLNFKNFILASPTASGKTLIALLASIKHLMKGGKAVYICPLRALASEKYEEFKEILGNLFKVALSIGDYDSADPWLENYECIVTTYEKADSLIRHNSKWLNNVSIFIIDEIHLLESERGATLEFLIARLLNSFPNSQYLALSATLKNAEELANWLNAEIVNINWRPVPLKEGIYINGRIIYKNNEIKEVAIHANVPEIDLTIDCLKENGQVLIFHNTRARASSSAIKLASYVKNFLDKDEREILKEISESITINDHFSKQLKELIRNGVAFHHAGLSYPVRKLIEDNFRKRIIKVISSTTTLSAGINVPARRVIIPSIFRYNHRFSSNTISVNEYKQLAGRAGRPAYDEYGEAIIISRSKDFDDLMEKYIKAEPEPINSLLNSEASLRSHILAAISNRVIYDIESLNSLLNLTFASRKIGIYKLLRYAKNVLQYLLDEGFIIEKNNRYYPTEIGKRVSELYLDPISAEIMIKFLKELYNSSKKYLTDDFLYLFIVSVTEDMQYLNVYKREYDVLLESLEKYEEDFSNILNNIYEEDKLKGCKIALILYDWIEEVDESKISDKYLIGLGDLYSLIQNARWLIYSLSELAKLLDLKNIAQYLKTLTERVEYGVKEELLELIQIPSIGRHKARILYNAGFKDLKKLKEAKDEQLIKLPLIGQDTINEIRKYLVTYT